MKALMKIGLAAVMVSAVPTLWSQDAPPAVVPGPPKVMLIQREYLKPGKVGATHERSESAFVKAMTAAKWPTFYLGMDSLSGPSRALFFTGYDTFDAYQKDMDAMAGNPTLAAALDKASLADGELQDKYDQSLWMLREDLGYESSPVELPKMRYFEADSYKIKPGHAREFAELAKMYQDGFRKAGLSGHWSVFESSYGENNGGSFLILIPMASLAEVDKSAHDFTAMMTAIGEDGRKKMDELNAKSIDSMQSNLFHFNPRMSYLSPAFIGVAPEFWKVKTDVVVAAPPPPPAAAPPAPKPAAKVRNTMIPPK